MSKRRGRNRKTCYRQPNGQPSRTIEARGPVIPPEAIDQRARIVGAVLASDPRSGAALGQLRLRGVIGQHHYDAGLKLYLAWGAWQRLAEMPARNSPIGGYGERMARGPRPDVSPSDWAKAVARYDGAVKAVIAAGGRFAWAAIDSLVIDNIVPPRVMQDGPLGERAMKAMKDGLDALVKHFGVPAYGDEKERAA